MCHEQPFSLCLYFGILIIRLSDNSPIDVADYRNRDTVMCCLAQEYHWPEMTSQQRQTYIDQADQVELKADAELLQRYPHLVEWRRDNWHKIMNANQLMSL